MHDKMIVSKAYSDPEIEAYLNGLEVELTAFAEHQGKEDAQKETELSQSLFIIKVLEPIRSKVQIAIDLIRKILLPTSKLHDTNEADIAAQKVMQTKDNEINDKKQKLVLLKLKRDRFLPDPLKRKYGPWFIPATIVSGVADGALTFTNFRNGGYPFALAAFTALAIALAISFSHFAYTPWLRKAPTSKQRSLRIALILAGAFIFFLIVSSLRAGAANSYVDITVQNDSVATVSPARVNGLPIALASLALFSIVLFLSLRFYKSRKERMDEEAYDRITKEIDAIELEIQKLEAEKNEIAAAIVQQKSEARKCFDYAVSSIRGAKSIGKSSVIKYKQVYARFHNDIVPAFFENHFEEQYEESFQFVKPIKAEL